MNKEEFIKFLLENNFVTQNSNKLFIGYVDDYFISIDFFGFKKDHVNIKTKIFNYKTKMVDIIDNDNKNIYFAKNYINNKIRKTKILKLKDING